MILAGIHSVHRNGSYEGKHTGLKGINERLRFNPEYEFHTNIRDRMTKHKICDMFSLQGNGGPILGLANRWRDSDPEEPVGP